jgi:V/A-type H+-transporting ATPase subunit A
MANMNGRVVAVNGNMVAVEFEDVISKNEVGYIKVGDTRLKGEVIKINGKTASLQVFESTNGVAVGDSVEFSGQMLSVELGPGLLTQVYDGLQNPLPKLAEQCGFFLQRGVYLDPIPDKDWAFTPSVKAGGQGQTGRRHRKRSGRAVQAPDHGAFLFARRSVYRQGNQTGWNVQRA